MSSIESMSISSPNISALITYAVPLTHLAQVIEPLNGLFLVSLTKRCYVHNIF